MLREHLSQEHNAASRHWQIIDKHVNWIHRTVVGGLPAKILDLGCGPGLYTSRPAKSGHSCAGIDYAPAPVAFARKQAKEDALDSRYIESDVRSASFGKAYGLVMMIRGEINVFRKEEARALLDNGWYSLLNGGYLVLEAHTLPAIRRLGERESRWSTSKNGLFSDRPYLYKKESFWDEKLLAATEQFYIVDAKSGEVTRHAANNQPFGEDGYRELLECCGFGEIQTYPSLGGRNGEEDKNYEVYGARASHAN